VAGRQRTSFAKLQRERARQAKQEAKRARRAETPEERAARLAERTEGSEDVEPGFDAGARPGVDGRA
jgi:hypothetical protein